MPSSYQLGVRIAQPLFRSRNYISFPHDFNDRFLQQVKGEKSFESNQDQIIESLLETDFMDVAKVQRMVEKLVADNGKGQGSNLLTLLSLRMAYTLSKNGSVSNAYSLLLKSV